MKGKTKFQPARFEVGLPAEAAVFAFQKIFSSTNKIFWFPTQIFSTAKKISLAVEEVLLAAEKALFTANQIFFAVKKILLTVEKIFFFGTKVSFLTDQRSSTLNRKEMLCLQNAFAAGQETPASRLAHFVHN